MIVLIVSDPHSNLTALEAVLADAGRRAPLDDVWCLGDVVGYGPEPAACLARIRAVASRCVAGNHDLAAAGGTSTEEFNPAAARAAEWTAGQLSEEDVAFIMSLPLIDAGAPVPGDGGQGFTLVHGSLREPIWEYLLSSEQAVAQFKRMTTPYSAVGHSHVPFVAEDSAALPRLRLLNDGDRIPLGDRRLIVNPGGCGQPRDGDPRAPYLLLDTGAGVLSFHRVQYDIARTQRLMAAAGLPRSLIDRLALGR